MLAACFTVCEDLYKWEGYKIQKCVFFVFILFIRLHVVTIFIYNLFIIYEIIPRDSILCQRYHS